MTNPQTEARADWRIDTSAGSPILVYQNCSVIQDEQAEYVLGLIRADHTSGEVTEAEPRAYLVHDTHVPRMPVKAKGRFPEPTEYLYPASRADDAKEMAKMMRGTCTPLFAKEHAE